MAKTRTQKQEILASYEEYLKNAKAIYLTSTKLNANEANDLKKKIFADSASYGVVKNTLFTIATKNVLGAEINLEGATAAVVCMDDVVNPAKALAALKKENKAAYVLCVLDGKVIDPSKIADLANLESREQLLGKLMYLVNYPTTGLARALANNIQKLMYGLNAVKDAKGA
jgi:large subunit ribosomal protein L10